MKPRSIFDQIRTPSMNGHAPRAAAAPTVRRRLTRGQRLLLVACAVLVAIGVCCILLAPAGCASVSHKALGFEGSAQPTAPPATTTQPVGSMTRPTESVKGVETHSNADQTALVAASAQGNTGIAMTTTVGVGIVIIFCVMMAAFFTFLTIQEFLSHRREMARIAANGGSRPTLQNAGTAPGWKIKEDDGEDFA